MAGAAETSGERSGDPRLSALSEWLDRDLKLAVGRIAPASADASFRRYFRVWRGAQTFIAMDAPPDKEKVQPFIHVAGLLKQAGLHAPEVVAADIARGFVLLSDLGLQTYLDVLDEHNADRLFADAIDALIKWQLATRAGELPPYDQALLQREMSLFPDWYVARHLRLELTSAQKAVLEETFALIVRNNLAQSTVYVHRDYMPRNLMASTPNPGILDFQDAVIGPISYDVASLFRDAFISWPEARTIDWAVRYWERARAQRLPVPEDFAVFYRDLEWMGLQRHLKVLGIFARIYYRDGKPKYLADTPRFLGYVRHVGERYADLAPLMRLLDQLEKRESKAGYTF